jgi:hypothetical protein
VLKGYALFQPFLKALKNDVSQKIQSVVTENSVITYTFSSQIAHFSAQINHPAITNPGYNGHKWPVPSF